VVVLDHAYHGRTLLTMTMTAKHVPYKAGFGPYAPEVYRAPMAYPFRAPGGPERATEEALARLEEIVLTQIGADRVAAIVAEPIQGEGGFIVPSPGFLPGVAELVRRHGIVFIADEIQTGFARTGQWFAMQHYDVLPDLMTLAKSLGAGLPISAVCGRAEIMDAPAPGGLGGTYAGNPLAVAAAHAVLDVIEDEHLNERAARLGQALQTRLEALRRKVPAISDVRGLGAMVAVEFARADGTPDADFAKRVQQRARDAGLLLLTCGVHANVVRFLFPLTIEDAVFEEALGLLAQALEGAGA
jgi:4-aminobutyrate aminotransferase